MPFKPNVTSLPNNFVMAYRDLMSLLKRLRRKPEIFKQYNNAMQSLLSDGHAVVVDPDTCVSPFTWYLPHFWVVSSEKFRVVFNPSATFGGVSLNSSLFSGPDLNNTLLGVLLRFRQHAFAFVADIKAMYLQVGVPEEQ